MTTTTTLRRVDALQAGDVIDLDDLAGGLRPDGASHGQAAVVLAHRMPGRLHSQRDRWTVVFAYGPSYRSRSCRMFRRAAREVRVLGHVAPERLAEAWELEPA